MVGGLGEMVGDELGHRLRHLGKLLLESQRHLVVQAGAIAAQQQLVGSIAHQHVIEARRLSE